jgi:hypothetical protein
MHARRFPAAQRSDATLPARHERVVLRALSQRAAALAPCGNAQAQAGEKEYVGEGYCAIPGAVMYLYLHSCLFPFFSLVSESLMKSLKYECFIYFVQAFSQQAQNTTFNEC